MFTCFWSGFTLKSQMPKNPLFLKIPSIIMANDMTNIVNRNNAQKSQYKISLISE